MATKKRNINELRDTLWETIDQVKAGTMPLDKANTLLKAADGIVNTYRVQLAHATLFKEGKPIQELTEQKVIEVRHGSDGESEEVGKGEQTEDQPDASGVREKQPEGEESK